MDKPEGRKGSDVLDAILDKVAQSPQRSGPATGLFRARALDQLDVADEVDARLPLVSRRNWLALVAVGLLVLAFALWAALTPSITSVAASGRVMAAPGAIPISTPQEGVLLTVVTPNTVVKAGDVVATLADGQSRVDVRSAVAGTVWQTPVVAGATIDRGATVVTLLPPDSDGQILLAVPEASAAAIASGMTVQVVSVSGGSTGTVTNLSGPVSASEASARTGSVFASDTTYALVSVGLDRPLPAGSAASATIVLSEGTVLTRLLGQP